MTTKPKDTAHSEPVTEAAHKECAICGELKPVSEFLRRTGKRSREGARRGTCRDCRKRQQTEDADSLEAQVDDAPTDTADKPDNTMRAEDQGQQPEQDEQAAYKPPPSPQPVGEASKRRRRGRKKSKAAAGLSQGAQQTDAPETAPEAEGEQDERPPAPATEPEAGDRQVTPSRGHKGEVSGAGGTVQALGDEAVRAKTDDSPSERDEDGSGVERSTGAKRRRRRKRKASAAAGLPAEEQTPVPAVDTPGRGSAQGQNGERKGRRNIVAEDDELQVASESSVSPESDKPVVTQEDEPLRAPRKRKRKRKRKGKTPAAQTIRTPSAGAIARIKSLPADPKLPKHASLMQVETPDVSALRTTRKGIVWMRGRTEKGKRWHQETDLETAQTLVREHAAVILNPYTVQRLYSNKTFRHYILTRDRYTCYFCGNYGDTIDHLLPRAKGGHTTPLNCVCACNLCNQSKADRDMDEFMQNYVPPPAGMETD